MADLADYQDDGSPQKEGTRIAHVNQQGEVQALDVDSIPVDQADAGITLCNTRWGNRSMGNGGLTDA